MGIPNELGDGGGGNDEGCITEIIGGETGVAHCTALITGVTWGLLDVDGVDRSEDIDTAHCNAGNPTLEGQVLLPALGINIGIDGGAEFPMEYAGNDGDAEYEFMDEMLRMVALLQLLLLFMSKEGRFNIGTGCMETEDLVDKTDPDGEGE